MEVNRESSPLVHTPPVEQDVLLIAHGDAPNRLIVLDREKSYLLGRSEESDLLLADDNQVSRQHARLQPTAAGGWSLTDLDSRNGVYVAGKLIRSQSVEWASNEPARIGEHSLRWQRQSIAIPEGREATSAATRTEFSHVPIELNPPAATVEPGGEALFSLEIVNPFAQVEHFDLSLHGLPAQWPEAWATFDPARLRLQQDEQGEVTVRFRPERVSAAAAGDYRFAVRVSVGGQVVGVKYGMLTVAPFSDFTFDAKPETLRGGGECRVTIENLGNEATVFDVTVDDRDNALSVEGNRQQSKHSKTVSIPAGETAVVPFHIRPRHWLDALFKNQLFSFDITVAPRSETGATTTSKKPSSRTHRLQTSSRLGCLLAPFALLALVLLLRPFALDFLVSLTPTATATPTPTATNTPTATPTATNTPLPTATNTPLPTATLPPTPDSSATTVALLTLIAPSPVPPTATPHRINNLLAQADHAIWRSGTLDNRMFFVEQQRLGFGGQPAAAREAFARFRDPAQKTVLVLHPPVAINGGIGGKFDLESLGLEVISNPQQITVTADLDIEPNNLTPAIGVCLYRLTHGMEPICNSTPWLPFGVFTFGSAQLVDVKEIQSVELLVRVNGGNVRVCWSNIQITWETRK